MRFIFQNLKYDNIMDKIMKKMYENKLKLLNQIFLLN